jgi:hypothetical protein
MMAGKDSKKAPEMTAQAISVRLANAHTTSAGAGQPGDIHALPLDEAQALLDNGYATRVP